MFTNTKARSCMLLTAWLLLAPAMALAAEERPRIMKSPHPDVTPTHAGVVYRETGSLKLRADVYLPDSDQPTTAIAWFPGGGFRQRNTLWVRGSMFEQFHRGVAFISFEYTLANESKWPAQAYDGKAAIRWLRNKAKTFNIDPDKIFVAGSSAGALIANVVANSAGDQALDEADGANANLSDAVDGVISFYGTADMTKHSGWPRESSSGSFLTGCASEECRAIVESASPVHYVSENSPPALLFHGMGDVVIGYEQSILLQERLNEAGADAQLVLRADLVHGDRRFDEPAMTDLITDFLTNTRESDGLN